MIRHITPVLALALAAASLPLAASAQPSEGIVREGAAARRATLDAMELKPFPADLWAGIGAWANGAALTSADTSGKPVVIMTWSNWYDPSVRALSAAQRIADQYAADGLIVVGLHNGEEWAEAESVAKSKGISFRLAHDTDNKARAALHVDQDPDIYVIDRAGQLRFADVDASALDQAAKIVSKESMDDAAKINQTLADKATAARLSANRTDAINQQADLTSIPELPFPDVSPELYTNARWPKLDTQNSSQEPEVRVLALPHSGWYPPKAPMIKGRAVIAYFWNPDVPSTSRMVKEMDLLQRERGRDVSVAGIVVPQNILTGNSNSYEDAKTALANELLGKRTKEYADSNRLSHPITFDPTGSIMSSARGQYTAVQSPTYAIVASSDGVVRWYGDSKSPSFKAAVDTVVSSDPGVKARRAAEQAWLRTRGK